MFINPKKILIISSDYDNFFFKPIIFRLKKELTGSSVLMLNKSSTKKYSLLKRNIFLLLMFSIKEILELIYNIIKFQFTKKNFDYDLTGVNSINTDKFINFVENNKYDLIVLINCVEIIQSRTLKKINIDVVNFHPGLLPKYRGFFPNFYSMINQEKNIGLTFHKVDSKIDQGPIIKKYQVSIDYQKGLLHTYKQLYFADDSINFFKKCILEYDNLKDKALIQGDLSSYYRFPKMSELLKFKFKKIKYSLSKYQR